MNPAMSEIEDLPEDIQGTLRSLLSSVKKTGLLGALAISGSVSRKAFSEGSDIDLYGYSFGSTPPGFMNNLTKCIQDQGAPQSYSVKARSYGYQLVCEYLDTRFTPFMIDLHLFVNSDALSNHPRNREFLLNINEGCIVLFGSEYYEQNVRPYLKQDLSHEDFMEIQKELLDDVRYSSIVFRKNYLQGNLAGAAYRLFILYDHLPRLYCAQNELRFKGLGRFLQDIKRNNKAIPLISKIGHFSISTDLTSVTHMYALCRNIYLEHTSTDIGSLPKKRQ
jgi:hypothetical protein